MNTLGKAVAAVALLRVASPGGSAIAAELPGEETDFSRASFSSLTSGKNFGAIQDDQGTSPAKVSPFYDGLIENNEWPSIKSRTLVGSKVAYTVSADGTVLADHVRRLRVSEDGQSVLFCRIIPGGAEITPNGSNLGWTGSVFVYNQGSGKVSPVQLDADGRVNISIPSGKASSVGDATRLAMSDFAFFGTKSRPLLIVSSLAYPVRQTGDGNEQKEVTPVRIISITGGAGGRPIFSQTVPLEAEVVPNPKSDTVAFLTQTSEGAELKFLTYDRVTPVLRIPGKAFSFGFDNEGYFQLSVRPDGATSPMFYRIAPGTDKLMPLPGMPDIDEKVSVPTKGEVYLKSPDELRIGEDEVQRVSIGVNNSFAHILGTDNQSVVVLNSGILSLRPIAKTPIEKFNAWQALANEKEEASAKAQEISRALTQILQDKETLPSETELRGLIALYLSDRSLLDKFSFSPNLAGAPTDSTIGILSWGRWSVAVNGDGSFTIAPKKPS